MTVMTYRPSQDMACHCNIPLSAHRNECPVTTLATPDSKSYVSPITPVYEWSASSVKENEDNSIQEILPSQVGKTHLVTVSSTKKSSPAKLWSNHYLPVTWVVKRQASLYFHPQRDSAGEHTSHKHQQAKITTIWPMFMHEIWSAKSPQTFEMSSNIRVK